MHEHQIIGIASILVLGIAAQWLAWRTHLPSILLLLICGFVAGPVTGVLDPDAIFGPSLFPIVSLSVAIILFEGGLSLKFSDLRQDVGKVVAYLTTVGIVITSILAALLAHYVAGVPPAISLLIGAILTVSGPTVIIPLLRQVRPAGNVGAIIKWEGIVNDPIGAIVAVLVFEVLIAGGTEAITATVMWGAFKALLFGSLIGLAAAFVAVLALRRYLVPDYLQNPAALMLVVICYLAANAMQTESGLLAVTVMGVALANQRFVSIKQITEFKEDLRVLLISSLFIVLSARLSFSQMQLDDIGDWAFVALLIVVVRPLMAYISTIHSGLNMRERMFVGWMAPRGIVAASVASIFAIRLIENQTEGADELVPVIFKAIVGTVAVYGITGPLVARWLKVAKPNPQGVLFASAHSWAREIAKHLKDSGYRVALVDSNWDNIRRARSQGLPAHYGNILSEELAFELQLEGIGKLFAMTPNHEVNSLAVLHFVDLFGRSQVYQLPIVAVTKETRQSALPMHLQGRYLFGNDATFEYLQTRFRHGSVIKKNRMTEEFDYEAFRQKYGQDALTIALISETGELQIATANKRLSPRPGQTIFSVVDPIQDS